MLPTEEQISEMQARGWAYDAVEATFWGGVAPGAEEGALRLRVRPSGDTHWVTFCGVPGHDYSRMVHYDTPLLAADAAEAWLRGELDRFAFPWLLVQHRVSGADLAQLTRDELVDELRACDVALSRSEYVELSRAERIRRLFNGLDAAEQIRKDHQEMFELYQSINGELEEARDLARRFRRGDVVDIWDLPGWLDEETDEEDAEEMDDDRDAP